MSAIADCPACVMGDHDQHVGPWNVMPGLIGGAVCDCKGDCAERPRAAFDALFGVFSRPPSTSSTASDRRPA